LSDTQRAMSRAYEALNDDAAMAGTSRIAAYLRAKRSWFVIDKQGIIRFMKIDSNQFVPSEELIEVVKKYQ
jgi:peroxiredoxin